MITPPRAPPPKGMVKIVASRREPTMRLERPNVHREMLETPESYEAKERRNCPSKAGAMARARSFWPSPSPSPRPRDRSRSPSAINLELERERKLEALQMKREEVKEERKRAQELEWFRITEEDEIGRASCRERV